MKADGDKVLTFFEAQDVAKKLAGGGTVEANDSTAPITVDRALVDLPGVDIARVWEPTPAKAYLWELH